MNHEHVAGKTVLDVERAGERIPAGGAALAARVGAAGVDGFGVYGVAGPEMRQRARCSRHDAEEFRRVHCLPSWRRSRTRAVAHEPEDTDAVGALLAASHQRVANPPGGNGDVGRLVSGFSRQRNTGRRRDTAHRETIGRGDGDRIASRLELDAERGLMPVGWRRQKVHAPSS